MNKFRDQHVPLTAGFEQVKAMFFPFGLIKLDFPTPAAVAQNPIIVLCFSANLSLPYKPTLFYTPVLINSDPLPDSISDHHHILN